MKRGGKRSNAGRKPVLDKKIQISIYIERTIIDKFGGPQAIKKELTNFIYERR